MWPAVPGSGRSGLIPAPGTAGHTPAAGNLRAALAAPEPAHPSTTRRLPPRASPTDALIMRLAVLKEINSAANSMVNGVVGRRVGLDMPLAGTPGSGCRPA
ncbi:hypothetical protein GCM10027259_38820 [Micromonospora palomenae]